MTKYFRHRIVEVGNCFEVSQSHISNIYLAYSLKVSKNLSKVYTGHYNLHVPISLHHPNLTCFFSDCWISIVSYFKCFFFLTQNLALHFWILIFFPVYIFSVMWALFRFTHAWSQGTWSSSQRQFPWQCYYVLLPIPALQHLVTWHSVTLLPAIYYCRMTQIPR